MKKLSTRHRKKQVSSTNLVHVKQIERSCTASGSLVRTLQNRQRSSESTFHASNSVEEEETVTHSNTSNDALLVLSRASSGPDDKPARAESESTSDPQKGAPQKSSQNVSESSLTLSLPKDITTSWLEKENVSRSDTDFTKGPAPHRPSFAEPGSRATAKSIFSTNKSLVMDSKRSSGQANPETSSVPLSRPPELFADASLDTSDYDDVAQFHSLDVSIASDKEFKSVPSKVIARDDAGTSKARAGPPNAPAADAGGPFTFEGGRSPGYSSREQPTEKKPSSNDPASLTITGPASSSALQGTKSGTTPMCTVNVHAVLEAIRSTPDGVKSAADVRCGTSTESRKYWSADVLPVSSFSSGQSEHSAAPETSDETSSSKASKTSKAKWIAQEREALATALSSFDGRSILKRPGSFRDFLSSGSLNDKRLDTTVVPEALLQKVDVLCKAFARPVRDVGTSMSGVMDSTPVEHKKEAKVFEEDKEIGVRSSISKASLEATPDDVKEQILGLRSARVSTEDVGTAASLDAEDQMLTNQSSDYEASREISSTEVSQVGNVATVETTTMKVTLKRQSSPINVTAQWSQGELQPSAYSFDRKQERVSGEKGSVKDTSGEELIGEPVQSRVESDSTQQRYSLKETVLLHEFELHLVDVPRETTEENQDKRPVAMSDSRGFQPFLTEELNQPVDQSVSTGSGSRELTVLEESRAEGDSNAVTSRQPGEIPGAVYGKEDSVAAPKETTLAPTTSGVNVIQAPSFTFPPGASFESEYEEGSEGNSIDELSAISLKKVSQDDIHESLNLPSETPPSRSLSLEKRSEASVDRTVTVVESKQLDETSNKEEPMGDLVEYGNTDAIAQNQEVPNTDQWSLVEIRSDLLPRDLLTERQNSREGNLLMSGVFNNSVGLIDESEDDRLPLIRPPVPVVALRDMLQTERESQKQLSGTCSALRFLETLSSFEEEPLRRKLFAYWGTTARFAIYIL